MTGHCFVSYVWQVIVLSAMRGRSLFCQLCVAGIVLLVMCDRSLVCQLCVAGHWCVSYVWQVIGGSVMCGRLLVCQLCVAGHWCVSYVW